MINIILSTEFTIKNKNTVYVTRHIHIESAFIETNTFLITLI